MRWAFLSPHLDDVALSCGGLVWEQSQAGTEVQIWTICAGDPPGDEISPFASQLQERWGVANRAQEQRRIEDRNSCAILGAKPLHFEIPDCIYRTSSVDSQMYLYASEDALFGRLHPAEESLVERLSEQIRVLMPDDTMLVCPLGFGSHVDHQLTRRAAEKLNHSIRYYADYPYILGAQSELDTLKRSGWTFEVYPVSGEGLFAWQAGIAAHRSQISSFWPDLGAMESAIESYCYSVGGVRLWRK